MIQTCAGRNRDEENFSSSAIFLCAKLIVYHSVPPLSYNVVLIKACRLIPASHKAPRYQKCGVVRYAPLSICPLPRCYSGGLANFDRDQSASSVCQYREFIKVLRRQFAINHQPAWLSGTASHSYTSCEMRRSAVRFREWARRDYSF